MEFEIIKTTESDVLFDIPNVSFPTFDQYRTQAIRIAEYIDSLEVTPENVKEVKTVLAKARKITDELNRRRIDIKKSILQNFMTFEAQVKELSEIVDSADAELRGKVKLLDEEERRQKKDQLRVIWDKRIQMFDDIQTLIPDAFDRWLTPKHLNKTTAVKSAEADMVEWLQDKYKGIEAAASMGQEYLVEYLKVLDLAKAIRTVTENRQIQDAIKETETGEDEPTATFIVFGETSIALTELLLKTNRVNYRRK